MNSYYSWAPVDINRLPLEVLLVVFKNLDCASLRACVCTCREWSSLCKPDLYKYPCLSSEDGLASFVKVLQSQRELPAIVRELHIRGYADLKLFSTWVWDVPVQLVKLVPHVRALTFESVNHELIHKERTEFWTSLNGFRSVTELEFKNSSLRRMEDLREMLSFLPALNTLTLSHVDWEAADKRPLSAGERWEWRPLSLRTLRLLYLVRVKEYKDVFSWLDCTSLRELDMQYVPWEALPTVEEFLAQKQVSLEALTFSPIIPERARLRKIRSFLPVLQTQRALSAIHLYVIDINLMEWVSWLFDETSSHPIARIALDFTLDIANETATGQSWVSMNDRLSRYWRATLRDVTLTHNPTGNFIRHERVPRMLMSRFPDLEARGILHTRLGVHYPEN